MRKSGVILLLAVFVCGLSLRAEEIQTKDGNKITGKIVSVTDDAFQIKTPYGDIKVPRSEIVSISFPENQPSSKVDAPAEPRATPVDESMQGTTYVNRTAKFQVEVPRGWAPSDNLRKQSKDIIAALESHDETLFFFVTPETFDGPIGTYRVLVETQYQVKFKDYEKLTESDVMMDGKPAVRMVWHGKNAQANNALLKSVVYIVPYDGRMVRLTFLTLEPLFDAGLPIFEKIAASYHSITP